MILPTFRGALDMRHTLYTFGRDKDGNPLRLPFPLDVYRFLLALGVLAIVLGFLNLRLPIPSQVAVLAALGAPIATYRCLGMDMPDGLPPLQSGLLALRHLIEARWTTGWGAPIQDLGPERVQVTGRRS